MFTSSKTSSSSPSSPHLLVCCSPPSTRRSLTTTTATKSTERVWTTHSASSTEPSKISGQKLPKQGLLFLSRPYSPIGRGGRLKSDLVWVRVPLGALGSRKEQGF